MKKFILNYEQPEVEIVEVEIEKGFAGSPVVEEPGAGNEDMGEG
jgi:hypothetical protein